MMRAVLFTVIFFVAPSGPRRIYVRQTARAGLRYEGHGRGVFLYGVYLGVLDFKLSMRSLHIQPA